jgi:AcrR family transcriptional regulator
LGHRELLLSAARRCLEERGYARTTARDLVAASGTNLASIGYHFGSKEALLNQAMMGAFTEYTEKLLALAAEPTEAGDPLGRLRHTWGVMVEMFAPLRPLLVAFIEAMTQAEHSPELRRQLAWGYEQMRTAIAETIISMNPGLPQEMVNQARDMASFLIAVNDGLMVQWLLDPERSLSGEQAFDMAMMIFGTQSPPDSDK